MESGLISTGIFLAKFILIIGQKQHLWLILCWKVILSITGSSNEKELLFSKLQMGYFPEHGSHIRG